MAGMGLVAVVGNIKQLVTLHPYSRKQKEMNAGP